MNSSSDEKRWPVFLNWVTLRDSGELSPNAEAMLGMVEDLMAERDAARAELEAAQQEGEWEYGAPYGPRVQPFGTEDAARIYGGVEPVRRRVFPWEPVPDASQGEQRHASHCRYHWAGGCASQPMFEGAPSTAEWDAERLASQGDETSE